MRRAYLCLVGLRGTYRGYFFGSGLELGGFFGNRHQSSRQGLRTSESGAGASGLAKLLEFVSCFD